MRGVQSFCCCEMQPKGWTLYTWLFRRPAGNRSGTHHAGLGTETKRHMQHQEVEKVAVVKREPQTRRSIEFVIPQHSRG